MTRRLTLTTLAALLAATSAQAADTRSARLATIDAEPAARPVATRIDGERIRVESEAQFKRDYGAQAEKLAPGVYLMNTGPFAGKTVSMGVDGLAYDLAVLQARAREGGLKAGERSDVQKRIVELETLARAYEARQVQQGFTAKAQLNWSISCTTYDPFQYRWHYYYGSSEVVVNGGLYLDRGDGSFNWYYARMYATALMNVNEPYNVFGNYWVYPTASVTNNLTGQTVNAPLQQYGRRSAAAATGYVYSGPSFGHDLSGTATAQAGGDCLGYLSVSDSFVL